MGIYGGGITVDLRFEEIKIVAFEEDSLWSWFHKAVIREEKLFE